MQNRWIVSSSLALLLVAVVGAFAGYVHLFFWSAASTSSEVVFHDVVAGDSIQKISQELHEKGVVRDSHLFWLTMRIHRVGARLKKGEYSFRKNMTPAEVIEILTSGRSIGRNFTISEGLNLFEISELFEKQGFGSQNDFLQAAMDRERIFTLLGEHLPSFEGYLYPETYQLTKHMQPQALVTKMVEKFLKSYEPLEGQALRKGWKRKDVVTLASIVEKETGAPHERPIISAVFYNRLKKGMKLQTDPTIIYGKALDLGRVVLSITRADLRAPHPYNTYHIYGLPPTPIANPGFESLKAALNPADTPYLYFVSQNDGTHIFSETYEGHQKAVREHQMNPKARQGKSWRDLKK